MKRGSGLQEFVAWSGVAVGRSRMAAVSAGAATPLGGDVNGGGVVDVGDAEAVGRQWGWRGTPGARAEDVDRNGTVDIGDIVAIGTHVQAPGATAVASATPTVARLASSTPVVAVTGRPTSTSTSTSTA